MGDFVTVEFDKIYQIFLIDYYNNSNSSEIIAEFTTTNSH